MPTKLGAHILRGGPRDFLTHAAVALMAGDYGASLAPGGFLKIGAHPGLGYDAQSQCHAGEPPAQAAQRLVGDMLPTMQANPSVPYWCGHNEPVWGNLDEMGWYAQFEIERIKLMAQHKLKCVIGNFATGTPPLELWPAFIPALQAARQYEAVLGLHEYSCPWMWWMTGKHQIDPNTDQGDEGWTTLRYRKVYRQYLIPNGVGDVPLAITECGIDPLVNPKPQGAPSGAWKQLGDFWGTHDNEPDKADYYFRQLVWYDKELQKDAYVVGACIFTWGSWDGWKEFDVAGTDVDKKLVAYVAADPAKPFSYTVGGDGGGNGDDDGNGGTTPRGLPRVQYERTYVLLPPDADASWAQAVVEAAWDQKRYTIGGSADDAGIGDLDVRRVIAVNPAKWTGGNLADFFRQYYPNVEYKPVTAATPAELKQKLASM